MAESLFSPSWYRVSKLTPRIRGHSQIHRHHYRGELWYVLQDHAKGRYYRFTPVAYQVIGLMDGRRTVQELWEAATESFGDDGPTQNDVVRLLSQLHSADVLLCDVPPDTAELLERAQKISRAKIKSRLISPLFQKFPLVDPERFLNRTVRFVRPVFTVYGAAIWTAVVMVAVVLAAQNWSELTQDVTDRVLSAENLLLIWLIYPVVKLFHEMGHAYAVKTWDGEVHEMGIMLLIFTPIPYVEASAASAFRARHRRVLVGAAGMIVELFLASLALFVWLNVEPGPIRAAAYNVILIASISTILFNANPLLRFDGYYILSDLLAISNLAQRSLAYLGYLIKRHAFGMEQLPTPYTGPGERPWLVSYSILAFVYRMFLYSSIILFIAGKLFMVGILIALWAAITMLVGPVFKGLRFVMTDSTLRLNRPRALLITAGVIAGLVLLLTVVPFPLRTRTEGVIWVPEESLVRAGTEGFVRRLVASPGERVEPGQVLVECDDPLLPSKVAALEARLRESQARYDAAKQVEQVQAKIIQEEVASARAELRRARERLAELTLKSPGAGVFVVPRASDLIDRYLRQGDLIGYVLEVERPTVRVVVPQSNVDLVRNKRESVEVRLAERLDRTLPAVLRREVPGGMERLPSTILGSAGGGEIPVNPMEQGGATSFDKQFQFDIELLEPLDSVYVGGRVYVRFAHGGEPLAFRWYRGMRRLFLRRFNV